MKRICLILIALAAFASPALAEKFDPARWDAEISKIEARDAKTPPAKEGVVFIGSSSIRMWDLPKYFPDQPVVNHGFGGSHLEDSVHYADRLVTPLKPYAVVVYAGDNDISHGYKPERVRDDFLKFVAKVHETLPETKIIYIAVKPSLSRWNLVDKVRETNRLIAAECEKGDLLTFIDIDEPMLGEDGKPRKELFKNDGLHMTDAGYQIWTKAVQPAIAK
ncbi:GDSL-type esterase/lipase family protein [Blastopirellula sp. JC732]|uniref:GDSL-type esterase/lipase family protein n=1 Tax=Blastopirellula sediminis TaxID=2894196 RepID=A0A9X1MJP5_9BACT|nr:SGNH/GDSL hydrolase family protein [Blastopirellula sediminis]MCC9607787.1 GDSL-type esterase/lipase family protein [Blastopirellula sediminis]MCC9627420.1 GDSL-type esterase/lipase family protein [Blastopirellula sediminis]